MGEKVVCSNKRARHDYTIFDTFEAGLILVGSEVKSLRASHASLSEAYVELKEGEAWLISARIAEYPWANQFNHEPTRPRKLLLKDAELAKLSKRVKERGFTIIPLRIYFKGGWAKVEIAVAKGKRFHDKRQSIKEKDTRREVARELKRRS
ncbi:MAG: SsrA-binding protein SmpB [Myxococcales bacterium]|nr:SsrA-binding protein SmpB [Myxococcales bacterium]